MMLNLALTLAFTAAALLAVVTIAAMLRRALPQIAGLRGALAACPQTREYSYRVVETVVAHGGGQVLALPLRSRQARLAAPAGLRAAA